MLLSVYTLKMSMLLYPFLITAQVFPMKKRKRFLICSTRAEAVPQTAEEVLGWDLHFAGQLLLHTAVL